MAGKKDKVKDSERFSIITPDLTRCWVCGGSERICLHEAFYGTANRKKSKEDGMIFPLCFSDHQGTQGVHNNRELDLKLKKYAQRVWESHYGTRGDFISRYSRNYLMDEDENEQEQKSVYKKYVY